MSHNYFKVFIYFWENQLGTYLSINSEKYIASGLSRRAYKFNKKKKLKYLNNCIKTY